MNYLCLLLTLLTFVTTRPFESKLSWCSLLQKLPLFVIFAPNPLRSTFGRFDTSKNRSSLRFGGLEIEYARN